MRRAFTAATLATLLACSGEKPQPAPEYFQADPKATARISGRATFEGKVPPPKPVSMNADPDCEKLNPAPVREQHIQTSKDNGLANVFIYLKTGLEGKRFAPALNAVTLDQRGCHFVPRVIALRAGQTLTVSNSDPVSHNIHPMPTQNRDWNQHQAPDSPNLERRFAHPEVMIPVKCNIHGWMKSYIGVLDHPYAAVTGPDGSFTLSQVPPGTYNIAAWHEAFGEIAQRVAIKGSEEISVVFPFSPPAAH